MKLIDNLLTGMVQGGGGGGEGVLFFIFVSKY